MARVRGDPAILRERLSASAVQSHIPTMLDRLIDTCDAQGGLGSNQESPGQLIGTAAELYGASQFGEAYTITATLAVRAGT